MSLTWIVQQNLTSNRNLNDFTEALESLGSKWKKIDIIPFADDLMDVEVDGPVMVYGSTTLIKNAPKKGWQPGVFFNPENFQASKWNEVYGEHMFNFHGREMTLAELYKNIPSDYVFLRPNNDLKDFSGSVVFKEELISFIENVKKGDFPFDDSLSVFVAPTKEIHKEWRCFVVNGNCVASSQYRFRSILKKDPRVPQEVIEFANKMAAIWSPEKAFVMDICESMDRQLFILELNCFNASGLYECDAREIIKAVEGIFSE